MDPSIHDAWLSPFPTSPFKVMLDDLAVRFEPGLLAGQLLEHEGGRDLNRASGRYGQRDRQLLSM